jgi:antitoxin (DNA-binding transcriptional repressor) of toxin-antitoxin stability system
MIEVSVTDAVNGFHRFLGKVGRGETVRIRKHGRAFARIVPDSDFMSGEDFSKIFADYKADDLDKSAASAIAANVKKLDEEFEHELADRHRHSH